jgi:hypothetical protein
MFKMPRQCQIDLGKITEFALDCRVANNSLKERKSNRDMALGHSRSRGSVALGNVQQLHQHGAAVPAD